MYTKQIPFKDFKGQVRNQTVHFNLTEREVFKLLAQLQFVLSWRDSLNNGNESDILETESVVEFYNAFEEILLAAYGVPSDDGLHFRKGGRYDFEESALFNACMVEFVSNPEETGKLIEGLLPKGMEEVVRKADANIEAGNNEELKAELARLRAQVEEKSQKSSSE